MQIQIQLLEFIVTTWRNIFQYFIQQGASAIEQYLGAVGNVLIGFLNDVNIYSRKYIIILYNGLKNAFEFKQPNNDQLIIQVLLLTTMQI